MLNTPPQTGLRKCKISKMSQNQRLLMLLSRPSKEPEGAQVHGT